MDEVTENYDDGGGGSAARAADTSRQEALRQVQRDAFELVRSAKEVKRQKAFQQKADMDSRRQQFGCGNANVVTFILDPQTGGKPRDIYATEISKILKHAGLSKDDVLAIKKNEVRGTQIEVELKESVIYDTEEMERKVRYEAKLDYSVNKFAYVEDIFKISGLPFHKNKEMVRGLIREAVLPFVLEIKSVEPGKYFEKKMEFFHGKENGEWRVKVIARPGILVPSFIIVCKKSKVVGKVDYIKISTTAKQIEVCYDCFKPGHKKFNEDCQGPIMVEEFAKVFEEQWKKNMEEKGVDIEALQDNFNSGGEDLESYKQAFIIKEREWKEKITEEEEMRKKQELIFQKEGESMRLKLASLESSIESLKEDHKVQNDKWVEELAKYTKENEDLRRIGNSEEQMSEKITDLNFLIEELKMEVDNKRRKLEENSISIEDLRKMYGNMVDENKSLKKSLKLKEQMCLTLKEKLEVSHVVEVVGDLQNEVEVLASVLEAAAKDANNKDGVVNSDPKDSSVSDMALPYSELDSMNGESDEDSEDRLNEVFKDVWTNENIDSDKGEEEQIMEVEKDGLEQQNTGVNEQTMDGDMENMDGDSGDGEKGNDSLGEQNKDGGKENMGGDKVIDILGMQIMDGGRGNDSLGEQNTDGEKGKEQNMDGDKGEQEDEDVSSGGMEIDNLGKQTMDGGKGSDSLGEQNTDGGKVEQEDENVSSGVHDLKEGVKRGHSPDLGYYIKKCKLRLGPRVNDIIYYWKQEKFVAAKIKKKVLMEQKQWYDVEHLDLSFDDVWIDLEDPNSWHYPEENKNGASARGRTSSFPGTEYYFDESSFQDKEELDSSPFLRRPRAASSPVERGEDPLSKMLEENTEQSSENSEEMEDSSEVEETGREKGLLSNVSLAQKTPYKKSPTWSVISGSDQSL